MTEYRKEILSRISESEFSEALLLEYLDGVVFAVSGEDRLFRFTEFLAGKLNNFIDFEKLSYSENIASVVDKLISEENRETLKRRLSLETVAEKLKTEDIYNVDFHASRFLKRKNVYKRVSYRYMDKNRDVIVITCEDTSNYILSDIDPLTGIYNLNGFHKNVKKWIKEHPGKKYRVQRYNIDKFRDINGIYGYELGNKLLADCGKHMRKHDTPDSFSAHLNADHFVRFCSEDSLSPKEYYDGFAESFAGYALKIPLSIHMGIYDLCEPDCNSYTMSYKALLALQATKGKFNRPIAYYKKGMMGVELEHQEFLNDLDRAIEKEEFKVWFQPQVNYSTKRLIGAEALIRWQHPERGLVPPGEFLPVFESSSRISELDRYMIDKACKYVKKWSRQMPDIPIVISVNLSRIDIQRQDFVKHLREIIESNRIPISSIRLEITESAYTENSELLIDVIDELHSSGFIVEMDDFGSGYSSLNVLKDIPIDILKLDMKFLSGSSNTERGKAIIRSVVGMASLLDIPVIAEGVETEEQADMLLSFGCENMQGYYFSKPVPAEEYEEILSGRQPIFG